MESKFVTESEVKEEKKRNQENWEKTRRPDQPLVAPEEVVDHRSLFERLKEQKDKKDSEWEESHMFKNQIRGLESEEVAFINAVDEHKEEVERQKKKEEDDVINEFRQKNNSNVVKVPSLVEQLGLNKKMSVKRKRPAADELKDTSKKPKLPLKAESSYNQSSSSNTSNNNKSSDNNTHINTKEQDKTSNNNTTNQPTTGIQVIGALPSLVAYAASEEEESQSDTDTSDSDDDEPTFNTVQIVRRPQKACKQ